MGHLRSEGFWVLSVDINENTAANANVKVSLSDGWVEQEANVVRMVGEALEGQKLTGILNVAGGWAGGNTQDADWVKNADLMWKQSVWSSTIAATIASKHLQEGGVLVLPGSQVCTKGTPGMMGTTWTPLSEVTRILTNWINNKERPSSGSLVAMFTENNSTYLRLEH